MSSSSNNAWNELEELSREKETFRITNLFKEDTDRFNTFSYKSKGLLLDLSKQPLTKEVVEKLISLADERGMRERIDALFAGERVNNFEDRPALHMALRIPRETELKVDGEDISDAVHRNLDEMEAKINQIQNQQWRGYSGLPIDTIVNICLLYTSDAADD